jgi:hypothetical protein
MFFFSTSGIANHQTHHHEAPGHLKFIEVELDSANRNEEFLRHQLFPLGVTGYTNVGTSKIHIKYDPIVYSKLRELLHTEHTWILTIKLM